MRYEAHTVTLPSLDFETYSEAGHVWDEASQKWKIPNGARRKGLFTVGAAAYSQHPSTEVLTLSYNLRQGHGVKRWRPGQPLPQDLFDHLAAGGSIQAHNAMFERLIWANVCVPRYGFPPLPFYALRCSAAQARVAGFPGALGELSNVLHLPTPKDKDGKRLLDKFSVPRNPTKKDPRTRIRPEEDPEDAERLYAYCDRDTDAEGGASDAMPQMTPEELEFWFVDQEINWRGIGIDHPGVLDCIAVLEQALEQYGQEFRALTGGLEPTQLEATKGWLRGHGVHLDKMDEEAIDVALERLPPHPPGQVWAPRRVLEIRQLIGSASVKKLYAMDHRASRDGRLRDLIIHHGARTGRPTGEGPQPLNLPKAGPDALRCASCNRVHAFGMDACPWCGSIPVMWACEPCGMNYPASQKKCPSCSTPGGKTEWGADCVPHALDVMKARNLALVEMFFGDALLTISGCIRGLFQAGPGMELIASDFSSIEAVVLAMLAGEEWRIDAFRRNLPIYLLGASKITGVPLEEYEAYKAQHGHHHPDRQKIGKVSELACGFGGWVGSYRAFGSEETDEVIKKQILGWRDASPAIVEFWGGQFRGKPWDRDRRAELFGVEGAAIQAIQYPGVTFDCRGIKFFMRGDALIIRLLSGRELTYNSPTLVPSSRGGLSIFYMTWNTNPKYGPMGWVPMETYGGRLVENIVQATAHDILRFAILALRMAGYPTVLHVYDEIVTEVPEGTGSVEEVERIMSTMPPWAADWPIRAAGGWRGKRFRKD